MRSGLHTKTFHVVCSVAKAVRAKKSDRRGVGHVYVRASSSKSAPLKQTPVRKAEHKQSTAYSSTAFTQQCNMRHEGGMGTHLPFRIAFPPHSKHGIRAVDNALGALEVHEPHREPLEPAVVADVHLTRRYVGSHAQGGKAKENTRGHQQAEGLRASHGKSNGCVYPPRRQNLEALVGLHQVIAVVGTILDARSLSEVVLCSLLALLVLLLTKMALSRQNPVASLLSAL